jgi:hypothetical protein
MLLEGLEKVAILKYTGAFYSLKDLLQKATFT